jgi:aromatic-L-amino-acid decarboxylase
MHIDKEEFKKIGYQLIDKIASFIDTIDEKPVTTKKSPEELNKILGDISLPDKGRSAEEIMTKATRLLMNESLLNGHPKFMGYITSSPAPIGMLADLLASSINPNVGAYALSPIATEIEKQTIKWLSEFIGVSESYDGTLVSGGNMANFTAFLAARTAKSPEGLKKEGVRSNSKRMITYCSKSTHTWIEKATVLFGHGTDSIRWIPMDASLKMDNKLLEQAIKQDLLDGHEPFMIIGTAGDVSMGIIDDLEGISEICKRYQLWFHIDGCYGIAATILPELAPLFKGYKEADSIALDPHKWFYTPLEAGCILMKNPKHLTDTFSFRPDYYNFNENENDTKLNQNYHEYGIQNSRGFKALKVWASLQQVGKDGYVNLIRSNIQFSELLFELAEAHLELEAVSQNLSITNLRYVPLEEEQNNKEYLDHLNKMLLISLQKDGEVFFSNAIVNQKYCLRGCIVNFRTSKKDIEEIIEIIVREGRKVNQKMKNLATIS